MAQLSFAYVVAVSALALCALSCNNKKQEKALEESKAVKLFIKTMDQSKIFDHFRVEIEAIVEKGDNFQLFYTEDYQLAFLEDKTITSTVNGSKDYQTIIFDLPKDIFPDRFRLDVGSNVEQGAIKIKSFKVSYDKGIVEIPQDSISKYLVPNEYITKEDDMGSYRLHELNIQGSLPYDPFFTCSDEMIRLIFRL